MKAVLIHGYGGPNELKYEDVPDPVPGPGEVLVRVAASSINPFDLKVRSGSMKDLFPFQFPGILGSDVSGTVQAIGPGVKGFAPGDKVFGQSSRAYASLCIAKESNLAKVPDGMDLVEAAALPVVTTTGAQLAALALNGKRGVTVLITGAVGNVGRSAVFTAKERGATVIAGVLKRQVDEARHGGADRVIALDDDQAIKSLDPVDAVADTVSGPIAEKLLAKVKAGGIFATVVAPPANASQYPSVTVKFMQVHSDSKTIVHMAEAVQRGKLNIPLGPRFPLKQADQAHAAAEKGTHGKILLVA